MIFFVKARALTIFSIMMVMLIILFLLFPLKMGSPSESELRYFFAFIPFFMGMFFLIWIFSIGKYLTGKNNMFGNSYRFFKISVLYIFIVGWLYLISILFANDLGEMLLTAIMIIYVMNIICTYYVLGYASKQIVDIKRRNDPTLIKPDLFDYIGTFFSLLFFPIGIWIIQPKVNKALKRLG